MPMAKMMNNHSVDDSGSTNPTAMTMPAMSKSIFMLVSREITFQMPLKAQTKLLMRLFIASYLDISLQR
jgi:hypothetical protein